MKHIALLAILALYIGVAWVESQWPVMSAGSGAPLVSRKAGTVQDRAWVEGCKGRCVKLASQRTPDEFPFYLRPVAAGDTIRVGELMSAALPSDEYVPLPPPAAARENTDRSGYGMSAVAGGPDSAGDSVGGTPGGRDRQNGPGVTGKATWYHPSLAGGIMRDGVTVYQPYLRGAAAATSWPIGTRLMLVVTRSIQVVISDTGHLGPGHVDLSEADFAELAPLSRGVISVGIREVE